MTTNVKTPEATVLEPVIAYVSDHALTEIPRFFGGLEQTLRELMQNSYRAGAEHVTVTINPAGNVITIADDGRGCPLPQILFGAGDTNWDEAKVTEPAGMGFFSIFNEKIITAVAIESCDWRIDLNDVSAVLHRLPIQPKQHEWRAGFLIAITLADPPKGDALQTMIGRARAYYPFNCLINGVSVPPMLFKPYIEVETPFGRAGIERTSFSHSEHHAVWEWAPISSAALSKAIEGSADRHPRRAVAQQLRPGGYECLVWFMEPRCGVTPKLPDRNEVLSGPVLDRAADAIMDALVQKAVAELTALTAAWPDRLNQEVRNLPTYLREIAPFVLPQLGWKHVNSDNLKQLNTWCYHDGDGWCLEMETEGDLNLWDRKAVSVECTSAALTFNLQAGQDDPHPYAALDKLHCKEAITITGYRPGSKRGLLTHDVHEKGEWRTREMRMIALAKRIAVAGQAVPFLLITEEDADLVPGAECIVVAGTARDAIALLGSDEWGQALIHHAVQCTYEREGGSWLIFESEWCPLNDDGGIEYEKVQADLVDEVCSNFLDAKAARRAAEYTALCSAIDGLNKGMSALPPAKSGSRVLDRRVKSVRAEIDEIRDLARARKLALGKQLGF